MPTLVNKPGPRSVLSHWNLSICAVKSPNQDARHTSIPANSLTKGCGRQCSWDGSSQEQFPQSPKEQFAWGLSHCIYPQSPATLLGLINALLYWLSSKDHTQVYARSDHRGDTAKEKQRLNFLKYIFHMTITFQYHPCVDSVFLYLCVVVIDFF